MSSERTNLLCRLAADGGRYVLTIALLPDEVEQAEKPTYGGKATSRFLTDAEYRAIFSGLHWLENQVGSNEPPQLPPLTDAMYHAARGLELEFTSGGPETVKGSISDEVLDEIWDAINTALRTGSR